MPRFSVPITDPVTGKVIGIACGSRRARRCHVCAAPDAQLECDGCDKALCGACSVSPKKGLDFCFTCFRPAWQHWLGLPGVAPHAKVLSQADRRVQFRAWARAAREEFLRLVPLGEVARKGK